MQPNPLRLIATFFQGQQKHYVGAISGFCTSIGLTLLVWSTHSGLAKTISLIGITGSVSYGLGIAATSRRYTHYADLLDTHWHEQSEQRERAWQSKHETLLAQALSYQRLLEQAKAQREEAIAKLSKAHQANSLLTLQVEQLTAKVQQYQAEFKGAIAQAQALLQQRLEARLEEEKQLYYQECLQKIKDRNAIHRERERFLLQELASAEEYHQSQWREASQKYEQLLDEYQQVIDSYHPELREIQAIFKQQIASVMEERDRIYAQLQTYHAAKPFMGSTKADINGNRLINFFLARNIICDAHHCESHFEYDEVWIRPRIPDLKALEDHKKAIQLEFELLSEPTFAIEQGCIKVVLRTHSKEKSPKAIEEKPDNWLETVARQSNHYRISAPTDAGKSVFLDNLIGCLKQIHGAEFQIDLLDPKFPFTSWQNYAPNYKGFRQCLLGMQRLGDLIDARIAEATADVEAGRPIRTYPAHLFAVDELEVMTDEARALDDGAARGKTSMMVARLLRKGLKLGRGLTTQRGKGIIVAYVTQSPLCTRINLNRDDFDNSTNIFLGENIPRALSEELTTKLSSKQLAYLTSQYELRRERGDEYMALVKTPKEAFIATLPPEGYHNKLSLPRLADYFPELLEAEAEAEDEPPLSESPWQEDSSDSASQHPPAPNSPNQPPIEGGGLDGGLGEGLSIQCPQCGSERIKRNGKKRGRQYYKCRDRNRQFFA